MFKRVNFITDSITVSNVEFSKASQSGKEFGIDIDGKIIYPPFSDQNILIFKGRIGKVEQGTSLLGKGYKVIPTFANITVQFPNAWNTILDMNKANSIYEDSSADGIDSFQDSELEKIGWNAIEFDVTYREIAEHIEKVAQGYIIYIERDDPYMFSGIAFISKEHRAEARELATKFVKEQIEAKLEKERDEFTKYGFSDDQEEALNFFNIEFKA